MLARRSRLELPDGTPLELPLLVPSFSSKGFGFVRRSKSSKSAKRPVRWLSNAALDLFEFSRIPSQAVLVSAYDLHFDHFRGIAGARGSPLDWLQKSRVILIDSGGYELVASYDSTEPKAPDYTARDGYGQPQYQKILDRIREDPSHRSFIIANFDWMPPGRIKPLGQQIEDARRLFQKCPGSLSNFILKPWTKKSSFIDPATLSPKDIQNLRGFDIIGVTEKELGGDILHRLQQVAKLRRLLDTAAISAPIHVWGGLDPLLTPLYYFAGAQIFDGVSWLRYSYSHGLAVNRDCFPALSPDFGISTSRGAAHQLAIVRNCIFLNNLAAALRQWVDSGGTSFVDFDGTVQDHLARAYRTMQSEIPELKGG